MTFTDRVYQIVRRIPPGQVSTYADIAVLAGSPQAARAVGNAMKRNVDPRVVPCHRVVGSNGSMHGYAFGEGVSTKLELLGKEGVALSGNKVDLTISRWRV